MMQVHPALSKYNWLFFRDVDDFASAFQALIKAIDTDLDHVRTHTHLLVRANEWDKKVVMPVICYAVVPWQMPSNG